MEIDYEEIADELIDKTTDISFISAILENHSKKADNSSLFYIEVMKTLNNRMMYSRRLGKRGEDTIIKSSIAGKLLYLNTKAKEWQIFIIIGNENCDAEKIVIEFNALMKGKTATQRKSIYDDYKNSIGDDVEIILRNPYQNQLEFFLSDFKVKIGESVGKNEIIGVIQHLRYTNTGETESKRYNTAKQYCAQKIEEISKKNLRTNSSTETIKNKLCLEDIFLDNHASKYKDIIELLAENHDEDYPSPFIKINGEKMIWETGIKHSFSYLAGFFYALKHLGWIYNKSEAEFIDIAKNTFNVKINSRTAFQKMKAGNLDSAFYSPFLVMFKRNRIR